MIMESVSIARSEVSKNSYVRLSIFVEVFRRKGPYGGVEDEVGQALSKFAFIKLP